MMLSNIPILLYHSISPFEVSGIWVSKRTFNKQIDWLFKNQFKCIETNDVFSEVIPPKSVLITFDDAYNNIYEEGIPILLNYGFSATLFVVSDYTGKKNTWDAGFARRNHMGWDRLIELSGLGFEIASHTHTHRDLTRLSSKEIKIEMEFSKKTIEDRIGKSVQFLSYPFGRHSKLVRDLARDVGYKACFSSNSLIRDRWAIGRMGITFMDTMKDYRIKLHPESGSLYRIEGIKSNAINFLSKGTPLWKSLIGANKITI